MTMAADHRARRRFPLVGNGLQITKAQPVAADTTLDERAYLIHVDATAKRALTLPPKPFHGEEHNIARQTGNADIEIKGNGKLIHGAASLVMAATDRAITIRFDEAADQWFERM